jgi:hypothetical protein
MGLLLTAEEEYLGLTLVCEFQIWLQCEALSLYLCVPDSGNV